MLRPAWASAILTGWLVLAPPVWGGQKIDQVLGQGLSSIEKQQWIIAGQVRSLTDEPIHNALVHIRYKGEGIAENSVRTNAQGKFSLTLELEGQAYRTLTVTVSAQVEGFLPGQEIVEFTKKGETWPVDLVLRPAENDDSSIDQKQLVTAILARYSSLDGVPEGSARKDVERGLQLWADQHGVAKAVPLFASAVKRSAECAPCRTVLGLARLDSGSIAGAQQEFAETALLKMPASEEPQKVNALILLAELSAWAGEFAKSAGLLMQALKLAPQDPLALQELGRTLIAQKNWEAADEYLQQAEKAGASPEAHLLRCRAVLEEGDAQESETEMRAYLSGRDIRNFPPPTRALYTQLQSQLSLRAYHQGATLATQPLGDILKQQPDLASLQPASDQSALDPLLEKTGANVEKFFRDFQNATSREQIEQEQLGKGSKVRRSQEQQFQYLLVSAPYQGGMSLDEYRTNAKGTQSGPAGLGDGYMLTVGFASASLVFHPAYRTGAKFRLLGRDTVEGTLCDVVSYAQLPERAKMFGRFSTHSATALVLHQGIAWIDPADGRILRLRNDLLEPLPRVRLLRETTEIRYAQVRFQGIPDAVSLPSDVTVTVEWKGKTFRNRHHYTDFKLFNTSAVEKRQAQQLPPDTKPSTN